MQRFLRFLLSLVAFLQICLVKSLAVSSTSGTVYYKDGKYSIELGVLDKDRGVAYGTYEDTLNTTGWGVLNIAAGTGTVAVQDSVVMYAAGYLEGALTARQIYENYINDYDILHHLKNSTSFESAVSKWFQEQDSWMRSKISSGSNSSALWRQMGNIMAQFDGLVAGYQNCSPGKELNKFNFQFMNGAGDLLTLIDVLQVDARPDWSSMTKEQIIAEVGRMGHCSALIKMLPGYEDILIGHSTWFSYSAMLRIYKHYNFQLKDTSTATHRMSFSSYPGCLESWDDFYIMDSGLAMIQTTNNVFDPSLYENVKPQSLLSWHRVRLSNLMAHNGKEWADIYQQYNSGTYNNQYMILDLKLVDLKKSLHDGTLWVVEQIPGLVESGDQTEILRAGYWSSYNVPFYENIYNLSGYPQFVKQHGVDFTHELAPRAKIFRRDQSKVVDLESLKHLMRYNNYEHDPYSDDNSYNAICSRGDLLQVNPRPDGCTDTKVTDYNMALGLMSAAVNGPTAQGLSPFRWSDYSFQYKHVGQPNLFDFDFVLMKPKL